MAVRLAIDTSLHCWPVERSCLDPSLWSSALAMQSRLPEQNWIDADAELSDSELS